MSPVDIIRRIAEVSHAMGWQAGVGGMETAGSIVSYLAAHPEHIDDFLAGNTSPVDWPSMWHREGCLTWHGANGKVVSPQTARHAAIIKKLELGKPA